MIYNNILYIITWFIFKLLNFLIAEIISNKNYALAIVTKEYILFILRDF